MPARRKPISGKQKKEQQQIKRAIKRGDLPPPEPQKKTRPRKGKLGPTGRSIGQGSDAAVTSARKLQSSFIKLPGKYLEDTKVIASTVPLLRPIDYAAALFHGFATDREALSCPKRPKWRFDMSKKEVEHNEEGLFKKWLSNTDHLVEQWQQSREAKPVNANDTTVEVQPELAAPPSPTYYEHNLEVWRQLWRVTEISQIILVLLDSRCPLLHYPPSLSDYLVNRHVILVLTKVDITGPVRTEAWTNYLSKKYPTLRVVQVESYAEKAMTTVHQGKKQYEPHIPETFRQRLVQAIKGVHHEMLQPPKRVLDNPEWLKKWVPPVKRDVDWDSVLNPSGDQVGAAVGGPAMPKMKTGGETEEEEEPDILTIGLIGQPNVGKSSLLNALFGARRVRASKTPGKTKHFQTLFWTPEVRLVDCPGLVMPNYVEMEMQVLTGIVPISRVSAIPACVSYAAKLLPLERIFKLAHPSSSQPPVEDKRTWREGTQPSKPNKPLQWTAMDILVSYANLKGWVTAKAGRPDIHRAGNAILRALAEGRISWGFWPSGTPLEQIAKESSESDAGIWIPGREPDGEEHAEENDESEVDYETQKEVSETETDDDEDIDITPARRPWFNLSRFAADLPDLENTFESDGDVRDEDESSSEQSRQGD